MTRAQAESRRPTGNLPLDATSFVGRRREVAEVRQLLSTTRLLTLTGIGGAGKSRLALQAAREVARAFPDGVWLVELDRVTDPNLLPHAILAALDVRDYAADPADRSLAEAVADKRLLLLLDNCEHIVDACVQLLMTVLPAAPDVRVLATSREPLNVYGEVQWQVPPLSLPRSGSSPGDPETSEAVLLFEERAAVARPDFRPSPDDREQIGEICRTLDGNPLALELAAARIGVLSPREILDRLEERFRLLTAKGRDIPPRHQTLYAAVDGTFELCSKPERTVWVRASVFLGSFDLESAEAVCSGDDVPVHEILEAVTGLVGKSVLIRDEHAGRSRFRMLETVRHYGLQRLRDSGEEVLQQRRHRDHYLALAELIEDQWFGPDQVALLSRLRVEWSNLWTAMEFSLTDEADAEAGLRIASALWPYWIAAGYVSEGTVWLDRQLAAASERCPARAKALWVDALALALHGDTSRARDLVVECHEILRGSSDARALAAACRVAGTVELLSGSFPDAVPRFEEALRHLVTAAHLDSVSVLAHADLGLIRGLSGDAAGAIELCEEGLAICELHREAWALSWILAVLCFVRLVQGEDRDFGEDLRRLLTIKEEFDDVLGILQSSAMLAWVAAAQGDARRAARLIGATQELWKPVGAYLLGFPPYLEQHEAAVARARAALGDEGFEAEVRAAAQLGLDDLVSYALGRGETEESASGQPMTSHGDLTPRQWEVAKLIARGLSDKEIAQHLVISPRTAETHVAAVLTRLGFSSRVQVAVWVTAEEARGSER